MPNARTNWIGTITSDQQEREAHRLGEGGVVPHRLDRARRPVAALVAEREPEALDHRPDEEEAEVDDGGKDQPVGQNLPPPSPTDERRLLGDRRHRPATTARDHLTTHRPFPLDGSGAQHGAFVFTKIWSRSSPCSLRTFWMSSPLRTIRVNVSR